MSGDSRRPQGEVFLDARGAGRALRLTWHREADVCVLSLWREHCCAGTFRLALSDVNGFVDALIEGLSDPPGVDGYGPGTHRAGQPAVADQRLGGLLPHQRPPGSLAAVLP